MRKFTVTRIYGKNDLKFSYDALSVDLTDDTGEVILTGDWYHDKIDDKIDGFFVAVDYLGIKYERVDEDVNDPDVEVE